MEVQPLEVYATDSNYAVIKPPGRRVASRGRVAEQALVGSRMRGG
jgi:hypothetical protein